jgi:hypothetical protein
MPRHPLIPIKPLKRENLFPAPVGIIGAIRPIAQISWRIKSVCELL